MFPALTALYCIDKVVISGKKWVVGELNCFFMGDMGKLWCLGECNTSIWMQKDGYLSLRASASRSLISALAL